MVIGDRIPMTTHRARADEPDGHTYLSTACYHATATPDPAAVALFHSRCRRECKFCQALCACACHEGELYD